MIDQSITPRTLSPEQAAEVQRAFILKVYGWMTAGLFLTAIASFMTLSSQTMLEFLFSSRFTFIVLLFAELGLVIWLTARVQAMSAATATIVFCAYSALTGVTLSAVFLVYTTESLLSTFVATGATFGVTAAYGYMTQRDLSGLGGFMTMGLIGVVIASIVNIFLHNETIYWITTYAGILIFVGLTAYDMQKLKGMSVVALEGGEAEQKASIIGALALYLDFINLFLLLLRLMGRRR
jgi:FtsH-binding integral membrane protein